MKKTYKLKKTIIMLKRSAKKIHTPNISWFIFGLCIVLMLMLMFPHVFQRAPIYSVLNHELNLPYELQIRGNVVLKENSVVYIHIGGYKVLVSDNGEYSLKFLSASKDMIPVCITDNEGEILDFFVISYDYDEWIKEQNIYLEESDKNEI